MDVGTAREIAKLQGHSGTQRSMVFGTALLASASRSDDDSVILWRTSDWTRLATRRSIRAASAGYLFTPDGFIDFVGQQADVARAYPLCRIGPFPFPFPVPGLLAKALAGDTSYREP